jgi:hypothetical protein
MSDNWYAPASLVIQFSFLIAGVWFARNILRTMRASQEQLGAMLKFSITGMTAERHSSTEAEAPGRVQPTESGPRQLAIARRKIALWLQAPMTSSEAAPWRRVINWLQAPAGS